MRTRASVVLVDGLGGREEVDAGVAPFAVGVGRGVLVAAEGDVEGEPRRLLVGLRDARFDVVDGVPPLSDRRQFRPEVVGLGRGLGGLAGESTFRDDRRDPLVGQVREDALPSAVLWR